jgi:two-component system chemotaxis response regulator CheB
MSVNVYVVDDSAVVRQTLQHLLQGDAEIRLIGSAPTCCCWTSRCPAWTA